MSLQIIIICHFAQARGRPTRLAPSYPDPSEWLSNPGLAAPLSSELETPEAQSPGPQLGDATSHCDAGRIRRDDSGSASTGRLFQAGSTALARATSKAKADHAASSRPNLSRPSPPGPGACSPGAGGSPSHWHTSKDSDTTCSGRQCMHPRRRQYKLVYVCICTYMQVYACMCMSVCKPWA